MTTALLVRILADLGAVPQCGHPVKMALYPRAHWMELQLCRMQSASTAGRPLFRLAAPSNPPPNLIRRDFSRQIDTHTERAERQRGSADVYLWTLQRMQPDNAKIRKAPSLQIESLGCKCIDYTDYRKVGFLDPANRNFCFRA